MTYLAVIDVLLAPFLPSRASLESPLGRGRRVAFRGRLPLAHVIIVEQQRAVWTIAPFAFSGPSLRERWFACLVG